MPGAVPALNASCIPVFDVGFSELMVIAVVALIVIGPERLPRVARTMGHLFGRLQRYVTTSRPTSTARSSWRSCASSRAPSRTQRGGFEGTVNTTVDSVQSEVSKTETELNDLTRIEDTAAAPPGAPQPAPRMRPRSRVKPAASRKAERPATGKKPRLSRLENEYAGQPSSPIWSELRDRLLRAILAVIVRVPVSVSLGEGTVPRCSPSP